MSTSPRLRVVGPSRPLCAPDGGDLDADDRSSIHEWRRYAWLALAVSSAAYLLISVAHQQAFHPWGRLGFFDLGVYHGAGRLVLGGGSLYDAPIWRWAPFTYPPFAAVMFTPLALLPLAVDEVLVAAFGVVALFAVLALALRLPMADGEEAAQTQRWRSILIPVAVAAARQEQVGHEDQRRELQPSGEPDQGALALSRIAAGQIADDQESDQEIDLAVAQRRGDGLQPKRRGRREGNQGGAPVLRPRRCLPVGRR